MLRVARQPSGAAEIFKSLQGEGPSTGTPSSFLRLAECNLNCIWCDTKYTWDWHAFEKTEAIVEMTVREVEESIVSLGMTNLVVTGGEPLLQDRALVELVELVKSAGYRVEVETNGTLLPSAPLVRLVDQWNVSPKLSNSRIGRGRRERADPLSFFANTPRAFFKFVVEEQGDIAEVVELMSRHGIERDRTLLMPEGTDPETIMSRGAWLADEAVQLNVGFSTRLHILLWGNERGK